MRGLAAWAARLQAILTDRSDHSIAQRVAGTAFVIRVVSAALAYLTQVLLARWMGSHEFGIFVYVWTWVMLIGGFVDIGIASSAQRFIPQYKESGKLAHLRGFLSGSRWFAFAVATVCAVIGGACVWLLRGWLDDYTVVPLFLACTCLPVYGVMHVQDGIARSFNRVGLALIPPYIIRQLVVILLMGGAYLAGWPTDAVSAVIIAAISIWFCALGQAVLLNRSLRKEVPAGEKKYATREWLVISVPMFAVDSLYSMLLYVDVLVLKQYRAPDDIAIYYAALKTLSLVAFVYFAVSAASAHRFAEYHVAGERERLAEFLASVIRWTFWPSVAATALVLACGWPLLWLFGKTFVAGYHLMFIFAVGLLARAAVGPAERFLVMLGEQRNCALVAALAFAVNLALCLILVPRYGVSGAALSVTTAFVVESVLLFALAKYRLGFHLFILGGAR